ncbi:hypothetical protein GCM10007047_15910 [Cerasicoccus arenae]|uniref:Lipoprotein n=2 Tax=Cerasicoccus arenae TaxID=424488 RepID=A0A8J3DBU2_9BACT|nr:hypothetical protein GCM10007047_15910 [Cerasicoccus arenae]
MITKNTLFNVTTFILVSLFLTACGKQEESTNAGLQNNGAEETATLIRLATVPSSAISVGQARKTAHPGQKIAVSGQIGGTRSPIAEEYASFVITDSVILFCNEIGDEGCETPWDACCEDADKLAEHRASVLFLNDNGQPLNLNMKQQPGLSELDYVTVTGIVAPGSTPDNLIIHANGLYTEPTKL